MDTSYSASLDNPLVQGIKVIGIGKHGSKPLSSAQIEEITHYLTYGELIPIQKGAFFGSLLAKGVTEEEQKLLFALDNRPITGVKDLYHVLCPDAPASLQEIGIKLLDKAHLTKDEAKQLGTFLYSDAPGETFRGMAASMLRIRYETEEEYHGLIEAANATFSAGFQEIRPETEVLVQLAEPFDGVEHSYMITPLLAEAFQKAGLMAIVSMGRSSGPKVSLNTLDIYQALSGRFLKSTLDLETTAPVYGWALNQQLLSPALDAWVERRKLIFKRPFLATLEKVLNPCKAQILVTSVFHITYIEKMIKLAGMAGFKGVIVLKRGLEGTLAPSLAKASGITCAVLQPDGSFLSHTLEATQEKFTPFRTEADEHVTDLKLEDNLQLIGQFSQKGSTQNEDFDKRVRLGIHLYLEGLEWIQAHLPQG
ncbi:anthranilate phosphoribosyltransferase [Rufibacter hautae]|uniref:Anthranilate phosphoribosyltransferase n=1 Tax=Rufibacter hautae TaxID=2595005 RepID=A0A5B6TEP0_9BACT|nr:anthranilate phosphoribosyltransferase [Rufibacter hautae]KAA3437652.1 anthranilate phosphoribosyltransferase [Rufibacter hautae]